MRALGLGLVAAIAVTGAASAQDARLRSRLDSATAVQVERLLDSARARGLPVEPLVQKALEGVDGRGVPGWLEVDKTRCTGRVKELPTKEEIALPVNEQLVVELYSR